MPQMRQRRQLVRTARILEPHARPRARGSQWQRQPEVRDVAECSQAAGWGQVRQRQLLPQSVHLATPFLAHLLASRSRVRVCAPSHACAAPVHSIQVVRVSGRAPRFANSSVRKVTM